MLVASTIGMTVAAGPLGDTAVSTSDLSNVGAVEVTVHDASRIAWTATVPAAAERTRYSFEIELEIPTSLFGTVDPWSALESYARVDDVDEVARGAPDAFRRGVAAASSKLVRARDGFVRHCTLIHSSTAVEENHAAGLRMWLAAMSAELQNARKRQPEARGEERRLADEFLSLQHWAMLTDCSRSLLDLQRALEDRGQPGGELLDVVQSDLAGALQDAISDRRKAEFAWAEPANALQLERLLSRMRWMKQHFERVSFLELESYQVVHRLGSWFSALAAMLAYLWFVVVQIVVSPHPGKISSGVIVLALAMALAYVSRDRIKEFGRDWLAGRVQKMFAQRVTRYRLPGKDRQRGAVVIAARESFAQSGAQRLDPSDPGSGAAHDVTLLRFRHRGVFSPLADGSPLGGSVRLIHRLDLSWLFPRLHDAVRGFASVDERTGAIAVIDVPRNYELPIRARLDLGGATEAQQWTLIVNKNGLVRVWEGEAGIRGPLVPQEKGRKG
jgi:hypothetical protein